MRRSRRLQQAEPLRQSVGDERRRHETDPDGHRQYRDDVEHLRDLSTTMPSGDKEAGAGKRDDDAACTDQNPPDRRTELRGDRSTAVDVGSGTARPATGYRPSDLRSIPADRRFSCGFGLIFDVFQDHGS
jgi:hypothetical protein